MAKEKEAPKQTQAETITCPACRSSISSDGRKLFKRSEMVEGLEEIEKQLPELEKEIERLQVRINALAIENARLKEEAKKNVEALEKQRRIPDSSAGEETDTFGFRKR